MILITILLNLKNILLNKSIFVFALYSFILLNLVNNIWHFQKFENPKNSFKQQTI